MAAPVKKRPGVRSNVSVHRDGQDLHVERVSENIQYYIYKISYEIFTVTIIKYRVKFFKLPVRMITKHQLYRNV